MIAAIIAAAGSGERFGAAIPKALIHLGDKSLLAHAIANLAPVVDQIVITAPAGYESQIEEIAGDGITVVTGGSTRSESVRIALGAVDPNTEFVLVHDAARALASETPKIALAPSLLLLSVPSSSIMAESMRRWTPAPRWCTPPRTRAARSCRNRWRAAAGAPPTAGWCRSSRVRTPRSW